MKKELLLSSMLLSAPIATLPLMTINNAYAEVIQSNKFLADESFTSSGVITRIVNVWENNKRIEKEVKFRLRMNFLRASRNYTYSIDKQWLDGEGLDYEVQFEVLLEPGYEDISVWKAGGNLLDSSFYAKKIGKNSFRMYDCDSTATCHEDHYNRDFHVFDTDSGEQILKMKAENRSDLDVFHKVFIQDKKK